MEPSWAHHDGSIMVKLRQQEGSEKPQLTTVKAS